MDELKKFILSPQNYYTTIISAIVTVLIVWILYPYVGDDRPDVPVLIVIFSFVFLVIFLTKLGFRFLVAKIRR